jgi:hypothetical protein
MKELYYSGSTFSHHVCIYDQKDKVFRYSHLSYVAMIIGFTWIFFCPPLFIFFIINPLCFEFGDLALSITCIFKKEDLLPLNLLVLFSYIPLNLVFKAMIRRAPIIKLEKDHLWVKHKKLKFNYKNISSIETEYYKRGFIRKMSFSWKNYYQYRLKINLKSGEYYYLCLNPFWTNQLPSPSNSCEESKTFANELLMRVKS